MRDSSRSLARPTDFTTRILGALARFASLVEPAPVSETPEATSATQREADDTGSDTETSSLHFVLVAAATLLVLALGALIGWRVLQQPLNQSPYDQIWATVYAGASAAILVLLLPRQGRLVIPIALITAVALAGYMVVRGGFTAAVLTWFLLIATTGMIGNIVLNRILGNMSLGMLERTALAIPFGLMIATLATFLAGLTGALHTPVAWAMLLIGALITAPHYLRLARMAKPRVIGLFRNRHDVEMPRLVGILIAPCLVAFIGSLPWILAPEIQYDALNYQLAVPAIYAREHQILEIPYTFWSYLVGTTGELYLLGLLLFGQPLPHLIHFTFGLLLCCITYCIARDIFNSRVAIIAAALLFTMPLFTWEYGTAYIDLIVSVYCLISLFCIMKWDQAPDDLLITPKNNVWLIIAGLMAGFSVATKLNSMIFVAPSILIVVLRLWNIDSSVARTVDLLIRLYLLPTLLIASPWFILRTIWTGNPVFPFMNAVFMSPKWPEENTTMNLNMFGVGHSPLAILQLPWMLATRSEIFVEGPNGHIGTISLMALPIFLLFDRARLTRRSLFLVLIVLAEFLLWAFTAQYTRYMLPLIPLLAILAGANADILLRTAHARMSLIGPAVMGLIMVFWLGYFTAGRFVYIVWHWNLHERVPLSLVLGTETSERFLSRTVSVYDALQFLDRQESPNERVLSVGNEFRLYSSAEIVGLVGSRDARAVASKRPHSELAASLDRENFGWLLVNWFQVRTDNGVSRLPVLDREFLTSFATLEFARKGVELYRLAPQGVIEAEGTNLLSNAGFEELDATGRPAGWAVYGEPIVDTSGLVARSGQNAVRADSSSGFTMSRPTAPGSLYTLGHWTRADQDGQFARLQVNWLDEQGKIVDTSIEVVPETEVWTFREFSMTAPDGTARATVYVSVHDNSKVWFDDVRFIERNRVSE
jgi:hypothetical protein